MMGVAKTLPKLPKLVMENVPPCTSSGFSWRERARVERSTMERCSPTTFFSSALRITGTISPFLQRHRDPDIDFVVIDDVGAFDGSVQDRVFVNGFDGGRFGDERQNVSE
jgi:hypothetical protein